MDKNKKYFESQEKRVADNYMSANGETPRVISPGSYASTYKLFTSQYFIGIGVGMLAGYFLLPKILKK